MQYCVGLSVKIIPHRNYNMNVISELQCWGSIPYWAALCKAENIVFEKQERFQKSGNRNRYRILSATGPLLLSVPVAGGRENKNLISEVKTDKDAPWQKKHLRAIESCYNKSPFYFYYADELKALYTNSPEHLWDWNLQLFNWMAAKIGIKAQNVSFTNVYEPVVSTGFVDLRKISATHWQPSESYIQVFGSQFTSEMCILDVLFNLGNETFAYLYRQSVI